MADPLLVVEDLAVGYVRTDGSVIRAVEGVSFTLNRGETLGLCGESGCGKSTLVYGLLRTLAAPGAVLGGSVTLDGHDLLALDDEGLRKLRWKTSAIVPQSALNALNPVLTIRAHVRDTLVAHGEFSRDIAEQRGAELLRMVDIDPVHLGSYPHELSGGMRQRVALALALLFEPPLLVMDEPTTALDVVVERGILRRVQELQERLGFAMLFITHDLALLLELATRIGVMYAGRMTEIAPVDAFRSGGLHPYTRGLFGAIPPAIGEDRVPTSIRGNAASIAAPPSGCRFHPRCDQAIDSCSAVVPELSAVESNHTVACPVVTGAAA